MANRWRIPAEVELRLRRRFRDCAYCGRQMKAHDGQAGNVRDKATIEHLNRHGPFYWPDGLREQDLVIVCGQCNPSRGSKRLVDWFESPYCRERRINAGTVAPEVRSYLRTSAARR